MNKKFRIVGLLAIMMAVFAAPFFTTKANVKQSDDLWIQTAPGEWELLEDQVYVCDQTSNICLMRFPEGLNPYDNFESGEIESADGFADVQP